LVPSILQRLFKRKTPPAPPQTAATAELPPSATTGSLSDATAPHAFDTAYAAAADCAAARDFGRAIQYCDQAIALDPARPEPYYRRANALRNVGRLDEAVAGYEEAIARKPNYAHAYCNRGAALQSLGRVDSALSSYDRAIALDPTDAMSHYNRALLMQECFRWEEALASYGRAIELDPQFSDAHYNRSMAQLFLGDFESGWRGYEWRWANAHRLGIGEVRSFAGRRWLGAESLTGKCILLYGEGGLGDTLQFCRYGTSCARLGATVILEVPQVLRQLLGSLEGVSQVISSGSPLPPFDYYCPLLSLPLAFKTTLESIPAPAGYLRADQTRLAQWRAQLGERRRPRVGLVWSGNPNNPIDARRSIPLGEWLAQLPVGFDYFRLQTQVRDADRAVLDSNPRVISFDDSLLDFDNTAALCGCMDVIITVDTSLAHLAGALGHRTWVLLPRTPDFRWMDNREDTPWYPTLKLYRQTAAGDWSTVFERVAADLCSEFPGDQA
jgi:tetratricopeptide (TPR) repeat protein